MEKARDEASWPHFLLGEYARTQPAYSGALGGKLNLFRFFTLRMAQLAKPDGRIGMIVPLALLADISCKATRWTLFSETKDLRAECFPQKDNRRRRVFQDAKLSTCVITAAKSGARPAISRKKIAVRTYPWNTFLDAPRAASLTLSEMRAIDPDTMPVPLVSQAQWRVCKKLLGRKGSQRLGTIEGVSVSRGEINQTIYREYITQNSSDVPLLKGAEVGRYRVQPPSQGHQEWFSERRFQRGNNRVARWPIEERRIATQRITGVDERWRIVATIVDPPYYFADSTNSVHVRPNAAVDEHYLLAILNSRLMQWRFKLTSSNNNVGTNELEALPIMTTSKDRAGFILIESLAKLAKSRLDGEKAIGEARSEGGQQYLSRRNRDIERRIDLAIYQLYGLNRDEMLLVDGDFEEGRPESEAVAYEAE
jgi:hypothetical protein